MTEADVTRQIRGLLKRLGVLHWKQHQGLGSTPGIPDILGCWQGRLLAIEVKAPNGVLSEHQRHWIQAINAAGGLAFEARCVDDVIAKLGVKDRFIC